MATISSDSLNSVYIVGGICTVHMQPVIGEASIQDVIKLQAHLVSVGGWVVLPTTVAAS